MQYTVDFDRDPKAIVVFIPAKDGAPEMAKVFAIEDMPTEEQIRQAGIQLIIEQEKLIVEESERIN